MLGWMSVFSGVYAIIDWPYRYPLAIEEIADALWQGGAAVLQLRAKRASTSQRVELGQKLVSRAKGAVVIINDDVQAAIACKARGVHLGQEDLARNPKIWEQVQENRLSIGVSTHDEAQFRRAQKLDLAYTALGPIYGTDRKANPEPEVGLDTLTTLSRGGQSPVVAIGGIDRERAKACIQAGADMVAMISALEGETVLDIERRCRSFRDLF